MMAVAGGERIEGRLQQEGPVSRKRQLVKHRRGVRERRNRLRRLDNWAGEDGGRAARMSGLEDDGCITDDHPCFRAQPDLAGEWRKRDPNMGGRG